jgi:hypothetical protein
LGLGVGLGQALVLELTLLQVTHWGRACCLALSHIQSSQSSLVVVVPCLALSCLLLSPLIFLYLAMSCLVLSLILSWHALSCLVLFCVVLCCLPCHALSCLVYVLWLTYVSRCCISRMGFLMAYAYLLCIMSSVFCLVLSLQ